MKLLQQQRGNQGKQAHGIRKASAIYMTRKIAHNDSIAQMWRLTAGFVPLGSSCAEMGHARENKSRAWPTLTIPEESLAYSPKLPLRKDFSCERSAAGSDRPRSRHCEERSDAAIQQCSDSPDKNLLDCRVATLLAMTI
ncbi:MAG: hypothetical protein Q7T29_11775 [Gallionella sp.]|nr:hypothetical protein [Gallionella sp.]